jgi:predicted Zn-dependent protease
MSSEDLEQIATILAAAERRLNARIEQVETSLLTAFHKGASPVEMRVRSHAAAIRALDAEQELQADRLTKLETTPPNAPQ